MASIAGSLDSRRHVDRGSEDVPRGEKFPAAPELRLLEVWNDADEGFPPQRKEVIQVGFAECQDSFRPFYRFVIGEMRLLIRKSGDCGEKRRRAR